MVLPEPHRSWNGDGKGKITNFGSRMLNCPWLKKEFRDLVEMINIYFEYLIQLIPWEFYFIGLWGLIFRSVPPVKEVFCFYLVPNMPSQFDFLFSSPEILLLVLLLAELFPNLVPLRALATS